MLCSTINHEGKHGTKKKQQHYMLPRYCKGYVAFIGATKNVLSAFYIGLRWQKQVYQGILCKKRTRGPSLMSTSVTPLELYLLPGFQSFYILFGINAQCQRENASGSGGWIR